MPVLTNSPTLGDLLKYVLNGNYTRETVTLKSGTDYALGAVLGRVTASGKYRLSPAAEVVGDEGAETAIAVLIWAIYKIVTSSASGAAKVIWVLVIIILPVVGFIAWLIAGPKGP